MTASTFVATHLVKITFNRGISSYILCTAQAEHTEERQRHDNKSVDRHCNNVVVNVVVVAIVVTSRRKGRGIGTKGRLYT